MNRLNSGIFTIFELSKLNLSLNSSDRRASKIIFNDTKLGPFCWKLNIVNRLFNFCVGVWVGAHWASPVKLLTFIKRCARIILVVWYQCRWYQCHHRDPPRKQPTHETLTKNWKLRGLQLRWFKWNQISTPNFAYQSDKRNQMYTLGDFEDKISTHMISTIFDHCYYRNSLGQALLDQCPSEIMIIEIIVWLWTYYRQWHFPSSFRLSNYSQNFPTSF